MAISLRYGQRWTPRRKGEIRDKFNIAVEKAGFSKDFRGLSGGEKRKVRLACALALQDMVANRASKSIPVVYRR
ncbi:hypothetical protein LNO78_28820 [Klebsiella pneumoniae subsp. pneumoniae]|nr:hypothetical protein [Klebsiella pneumoniae subsp. pneumoniae]